MFRRYADDDAAIADLARWLTEQGAPTRTASTLGPEGDQGHAAQHRLGQHGGFGKPVVEESPGLNRVAACRAARCRAR